MSVSLCGQNRAYTAVRKSGLFSNGYAGGQRVKISTAKAEGPRPPKLKWHQGIENNDKKAYFADESRASHQQCV